MISVCMATYNGAEFVLEQINSILIQLGENDELIISDDGSSDDTKAIITSVNDHRIKLMENKYKHGYTANFYNALKYAKGEYIFLSDQDDIWLPNKVEMVLKHLREVDFVHTNAKIVDVNLNTICESRNAKYGVKSGYINNLVRSRYLGCCMAFNRSVLKSLFPVPIYDNSYPHDLWIALISEKYFRTRLIEDCLVLYRRHEGNVSDGGTGDYKNVFLNLKRIIRRLYYHYYVIKQRRICIKNSKLALHKL